MLKQSLVQEKLSDLAMAAQASSSSATTVAGSGSAQASINTSSAHPDLDLKNQWPRVQLIKNKPKTYSLTHSPTNNNNNNNNNINYNPKYLDKLNDDDNEENLDYDGIETVNYYSNRHGQGETFTVKNANQTSQSNGLFTQNTSANLVNSSNSNSNQYTNSSAQNYPNSNQQSNSLNQHQQYNQQNQYSHHIANDKNSIQIVSDSNQYDPNLKLKYLEKSIKFIQQQHNDTLNGLHQEIEKLKNENRELHFKLATRKSSTSSLIKEPSSTNIKRENAEAIKSHTSIKDLKTNEEILNDKIEQRGFDKALKEALKERNIEKRLSDIKINYEANKYEDLFTRLVDAESKNEYLTNIINQLQAKRSINSGYRPNVNTNLINNNTTSITQQQPKININQIYSVEPLRIKLNDHEEPRAPSLEESEMIIKKLFELYKQQKQQISNMKVVLKDMMHNENLSNQAMMMTKDLLENPNKFTHYILDGSNLQKLSILAPLTNYPAPKSSNGRLNYNTHRYHSQLLSSNGQSSGYESMPTGTTTATTTSSNINLSSIVHLPPLSTINPAKFPERQRKTQILQKQRLRREFYH